MKTIQLITTLNSGKIIDLVVGPRDGVAEDIEDNISESIRCLTFMTLKRLKEVNEQITV